MSLDEIIYDKWPEEYTADDAMMKSISKTVIETAQRYGTKIVVMSKNGKIEEISPATMRRRLAAKRK